ncbi:MAG: hypothetical protein Q8Q54_08570 [Methylococcales bacterium]|nr:hypothetical protein [Methylococcales bacterium]MDP3838959.1 hypothetical protein [Methylococcales bacterium]
MSNIDEADVTNASAMSLLNTCSAATPPKARAAASSGCGCGWRGHN